MRRNNKSLKKLSPQKVAKKKQCASKCIKNQTSPLNVQCSLYRKYSNTQNFHYMNAISALIEEQKSKQVNNPEEAEQCLEKYYKSLNRRHLFPKIKQVYKMHTDIPKISHPEVKKIIDKCYHRKRLLDYFKIAKVLGIKVDNLRFSTFLLSMNEITNKRKQGQKNFDRIITKISTIDFSTEAQRNLLRSFLGNECDGKLNHKQNWISASNSQSNN